MPNDHEARLARLETTVEAMSKVLTADLIIKIDRAATVAEDTKKLVWVLLGAMAPTLISLIVLLIRMGGKP